MHLQLVHSIAFIGEDCDDPAEEWLTMAQYWIDCGHTGPHVSSNEAMDYYSGPDQKLYSDEEEFSPPSPKLPSPRTNNSGSSSDGSSGNISNGKSKKKSRNARTAENSLRKILMLN